MTITLKVYKESPEHSEYMVARFPKDRRHHSCSNETFEYKGHRWKYEATSFDDNGDYDLLWRPDAKEPELMLADISFRDYVATEAMNGILSNHCMIDNVTEQSVVWVAKESYLMADAMLKARG
ncbi:hypothetical protein OSB94_18265 [Proteus vulgaris]|uniref:hypothetical protein n=1 Tax=Proteus vulgaris TaxID=585 RepID=UPI00287513A4|nr:hypothetical protein [Proteus vulgaris]MDS0790041.1 hypothetical protein [Proteus vulgaris]